MKPDPLALCWAQHYEKLANAKIFSSIFKFVLLFFGNDFSVKKIPGKIVNMRLRMIFYWQDEELYDRYLR